MAAALYMRHNSFLRFVLSSRFEVDQFKLLSTHSNRLLMDSGVRVTVVEM